MKEIEKIFKQIVNKIYLFTLFQRTQIIGLSWEVGFMTYLMGGFGIAYPIMSYVFTIFLFEFSFISIWSLIIFFLSLFLFGIIFGFRISISEKHLIFYPTIFFIPYNRIKVNLSNVNFKEIDTVSESNQVYIYHEYDPWCEMGFCDWVKIKSIKKCYEIGGNENYDVLLKIIKSKLLGKNI